MAQTEREGKRNQTKLALTKIKDEPIQVQRGNRNLNDAFCDVCLVITLSSVNVNFALYLCYVCNKYLCQKCFKDHESHQFFERREKERLKKCFRDEIMNESKSERKELLDREDVSLVERVNVKHELDKNEDYWITGLCGLGEKCWVICDNSNHCIKIFSIGSHILQRYIRFRSEPRGVTEIKVKRKKVKPLFKRLRSAINTFFSVKRESTWQGIVPTPDVSVLNQPKSEKQSLLAVTFPGERRILFIDLTQNPAEITKSIKTRKHCRDIAFSGDQIVTLCHNNEYSGCRWSIYVLSTGGVELKTINAPLDIYEPSLAVCPGRFYLTDSFNRKVHCINNEGNIVSYKTAEGSWPYGISVDPDTEKVYICVAGNKKLNRLDFRLESLESLFNFDSEKEGGPDSICIYRDRLYISHGQLSTHEHIVSVVRVI